MIVSSIQQPHARRADRKPAADQGGPSTPLPASTALVPVTEPPATGKLPSSLARPDIAFVAHLIAIAQQAPQTRTLRRASPEEAHALYRSQPVPAARGIFMSKNI